MKLMVSEYTIRTPLCGLIRGKVVIVASIGSRGHVFDPPGSTQNQQTLTKHVWSNPFGKGWPTSEVSKVTSKLGYEKSYANNLPLRHFIVEDVQEKN